MATKLNETTSTASAGDYSYETPKVFFPGTHDQWLAKWEKKLKKDKMDDMTIVKPQHSKSMSKTLFDNLNEGTNLGDLDMLAKLLESVSKETSALMEDKKPDALVRIERIHKETEKDELGYFKAMKDRNLDMKDNKDGSKEQQHDYENDSMEHKDVPMHHPSKEEEKYVQMGRGLNLADRAIIGNDNDEEALKRIKDEAGKDIADAAIEKKKEIEDTDAGSRPAGRFTKVNENVNLSARYKRDFRNFNYVGFNANEATLLESKTPIDNLTLLETKGLGNVANESAKTLIESYDFYVDLNEKRYYKRERSAQVLKESIELKKSDYDRQRELLCYTPKSWVSATNKLNGN